MADSRVGPETCAAIAAVWHELLDAIANGAQVGESIKAAGFTRGQIRGYLMVTPGARKDWDEARIASADAFFDQAHAIANNTGGDAKLARVRLQALQWLAGKRNPVVYGDKQTIDMNVKHVDLTAIIQAANARLAASRLPATIEGERVPDLLPVQCSIAELM